MACNIGAFAIRGPCSIRAHYCSIVSAVVPAIAVVISHSQEVSPVQLVAMLINEVSFVRVCVDAVRSLDKMINWRR